MTSKEALEIFYKDIQAYNNDMRKYPYFKCYSDKCEKDIEDWEAKQKKMYKLIKKDLDDYGKLVKEKGK